MSKDDLEILCEVVGRSRGWAIAQGTVNFVRRWPGPGRADLLRALLAGCLVSIAFLSLALVPVILAFSPRTNDTCHLLRTSLGREIDRSMNVYFVKHENRIWTSEELCCVETAARLYPEYNIFMINLLTRGDNLEIENELNADFFDELIKQYVSSIEKNIITRQDANSSESEMRYRLSEVPNVRNVDISIKRLFSRSPISKKIESLNSEKIELAAKFQVIWDSPGITLEPLSFNQLESVRDFYNKSQIDTSAGIQLESDVQITRVACQSFIGLVISEMAKSSFTDRHTLLKHALMNFCPSPTNCSAVRIIKTVAKSPPNFTTCPTIYSVANSTSEINDNITVTTT